MPLLLVLGACAQPVSASSDRGPAPSAELARFYDQELRFTSCAGYATTAADETAFAADPAFSYTDAVNATIAALYNPATWPAIDKGLRELQAGDPSRFVNVLQLFSGREPDGRGRNMTSANLAISCMDEQRMSPADAETLRDRIYRATPFADPGLGSGGARDVCEAWPTEPEPTYPLPDRVEGLAPTLTISFTRDPTTPYDGAVRMAQMLGGSLLTADGDGQTIAATGTNECVNQVVANYLTTLRTPSADTRCAG